MFLTSIGDFHDVQHCNEHFWVGSRFKIHEKSSSWINCKGLGMLRSEYVCCGEVGYEHVVFNSVASGFNSRYNAFVKWSENLVPASLIHVSIFGYYLQGFSALWY